MADYEQMSKDELYEVAQERDIEGRSDMTKAELLEAIRATADPQPQVADVSDPATAESQQAPGPTVLPDPSTGQPVNVAPDPAAYGQPIHQQEADALRQQVADLTNRIAALESQLAQRNIQPAQQQQSVESYGSGQPDPTLAGDRPTQPVQPPVSP